MNALQQDKRITAMVAKYKAGATLEAIGQQYGVSRERVRQLLARRGIKREHGGAHKKRADYLATIQQDRHKRHAQRGCTPDEYVRILEARAGYAYTNQRLSASWRGIAWELTLGDWWRLWEASGRWAQRGRGGDKYCLARKSIDNGFTLDNVHICLNTEAHAKGGTPSHGSRT